MTYRYIGPFPPPAGGVTRKNQVLREALSAHLPEITGGSKIPGKLGQAVTLLLALLPGQRLIIGLSGKGGKSFLLTRLLYGFDRKTMGRSLYFMMGGWEHRKILGDEKAKTWFKAYKRIYVETAPMAKALEEAGFTNVAVYPNCRFRPRQEIVPRENREGPLRCLFLSQLTREKGADLVLATAEALPQVEFTLYGQGQGEEGVRLQAMAKDLPNVKYPGLCTDWGDTLYQRMQSYDVLLFPTRWETEGVPGVLAEAKISGLVPIVSPGSYNPLLVRDGREGFVLPENTPEALTAAIFRLDQDRALLYRLKQGSLASAQEYYADCHIEDILRQLQEAEERL